MQVSFVCSEHSLKGQSPEERLGRPVASSPSPGTRGRSHAVAMVARSLGQLSVQSLPCTGNIGMKQPGMKYRYKARGGFARRGRPSLHPHLREPSSLQSRHQAVCVLRGQKGLFLALAGPSAE